MKIIITGVAGFVGSNLAEALLRAGHEIIGIDNFSYGSVENLRIIQDNKGFSFHKNNCLNYETFKNLQADCLVHLASQKIPRYSNSYKTIYENDLMSNNVIKKCLTDDIRLVFASTSDIYGKNPQLPFDEESNSVLGPTNVKRWAYATSKIFSEHKILASSAENGLKYTILRFFGSYGKHQNRTWWGGPQSVFIDRALKNEFIEVHGDGCQTRTFTYIDDLVQGIRLAIERDEAVNEIFNVASDQSNEIQIKDLAKLIWSLIRSDEAKIKLIPYETFGKYEDVMRRVPSIEKIKRKLNYEPKFNLEDGLRRTIEWQKKVDTLEV
ncbi:MAG: NAD(P)-dependent oxidoreductase [Flavobacteriales bacterium]|nr:NAD(P)-dependent oxidoreductase [Flavobacteriales bacterium]